MAQDTDSLRTHLVDQLTGNHAHAGLKKATNGIPFEDLGTIPDGCVHSIWMLVEHIRRAQHDILDFSRNPDYEMPSWPDDYWPSEAAPADEDDWKQTLGAINNDRQAMVELINDPLNDVLAPIPHGDGQTLFREAMLIVDHTAYHVGQIVHLRRLLGNWS